MNKEKYIDFAHEIADASANIIVPYFRNLSSINIKSDKSPVTIADKEAEMVVRKMITARFPEHGIIGEEEGLTNPNAEYIWVIDPIDGTKNFMTGQPIFGTLIALLHNGEPIIGLMNQPITKERWISSSNRKTTLNNTQCRVRTFVDLSDAILSTTSPYLFVGEKQKTFHELETKVKYSIYGSDCYAYAMLAMGQLDLVVESGLKLHDIMALIPIIEGAGGVITDWQGKSIQFNPNINQVDIIACSDNSLHKQVLYVLEKSYK